MAAGGEVVGLIPARLLEREVGHRAITELIVARDMFDRKDQMIARADAFVVLPGGLGTLDELLEVVTLRQLGYHGKPIVLVNLAGYWDPLVALVDRVVEQGFAGTERAHASTRWSLRSRRCCRRSASTRRRAPRSAPPRPTESGRRGSASLRRSSRRRWLRPAAAAAGPAPAPGAGGTGSTKSIGSIISGGKPPSRVTSATIRRANGNSSRGHSISSTGCRLSGGMLASENSPP